MTITVGELAGLPHLRMEVLAGSSGLDHLVTWAHSSDLDQPWGWLSGGELLMKNGRTLPRSDDGQVDFIEGLVSAHTSALVIGSDPESPPLCERALRRANDLNMPVLKVPYSMSFIVLSRTVADALLDEEASRATRTEKIYDTIHAAVAGDDPGVFVRRLKVELSCELYIVDSETLDPIFDGTPSPPDGLRNRLREEIVARGGAVAGALRFAGDKRGEVVVVEVPYEEPTFLVAVYPNRPPLDLVLLQHAATAVAVEVAHASLRADYQRQLGTEVLSQLLEGRFDAQAGEAQLGKHSMSPAISRLLAIEGANAAEERRLHVGLRRRGIAHLLLRRDRVLFLLLEERPSDRRPLSPTVTSLLDRLSPDRTVGISNPLIDSSRAPATAREALWALAGASSGAPIMTYEDASPLPALQSQDEAQALISRVLGSLLEYDAANGSDLVHSLSVFFATRRSWQRCAETLNVHRQTVIYRMRRIEELTGRKLSETSDLAILWLALSAYAILGADQAIPAHHGSGRDTPAEK
jgi:PucR family transcriptional regulator, purine catabolism regulatory protein